MVIGKLPRMAFVWHCELSNWFLQKWLALSDFNGSVHWLAILALKLSTRMKFSFVNLHLAIYIWNAYSCMQI